MSEEQPAPQPTKIIWNDEKMQTTYANAVNAVSSREEVAIFFGTNRTWKPDDDGAFTVELSDRMILNPLAAKRLHNILGAVLNEYESRFAKLDFEAKGE